MKTFFTSFFLFFLCISSIDAQQASLLWLKEIGGNGDEDVVPQVTKTADGGFIIGISSNSDTGTGNIDSFCALNGSRSIFVKYNADASTMEWSKCYIGTGDTGLGYMFPQNDGGNVLGGEYLSGWGFYICKQDALGNIVWSHGYSEGNGAIPYDMIATSDGGYMMIGIVYYTDTNFTVHNSGSGNADIGVMKVDSLGNKQWSEAIGGSEDDEGAKAVSIPGSGYYIFGYTLSNDYDCTGNHGASDAYLARLNSAGNILWHNDLGGSNYDGGGGGADNGYAIADGNGGIIMVSASASSDGDVSHHINPGTNNIWMVDVDSSNNIVWNNCYGGGGGDLGGELPNSVCMATDGSLWIAGESQAIGGEVDTAYGGNSDAWFVHTDGSGNFINAKVLGSNGQDDGYMIYPLSNGNVIAGGYYEYGNGTFNVSWGTFDAFLATFSPWTEDIQNLSSIDNSVNIYPNPANQEVTIKINQTGNYNVVITDVLGRTIYNTQIKNEQSVIVPVNNWPGGVYYVQVVNESGYSNVQKLIVQ